MYSKNVLFQSKNGTLGTRIDLAWNKLIAQASNEQEQRDTLEFLVFVFDIDIYANPNTSIIDQLSFMMMERKIYKNDNPEYITNQAPKILAKIEITPALRVTQKAETDQSASPKIAAAIKNQELIEVVSPRLLIRNGEFYHEGEKFDSSKFSSHGTKQQSRYNMRLAEDIYAVLNKNRKNPNQLTFNNEQLIETLEQMIHQKAPIVLLLAAFHLKSRNLDSVISHLPDAGEALGLNTLHTMLEEIQKIYPYGAKLILLHEGHFYADTIICQNDQKVDDYLSKLRQLMLPYKNISSVDINHLIPNEPTYELKRKYFIENYSPSRADIEELIASSPYHRYLYTAYKKIYLVEYKNTLFTHYVDLKRREFRNIAKEASIAQLQKYIAFGRLINASFKATPHIKLSVLYKSPDEPDKIGINLIPNNHSTGTTCFYSLAKYSNGHFHFMKKSAALAQGFILAYYSNNLPFFEQVDYHEI
jgi:L-tyrosine isonitrile synthase